MTTVSVVTGAAGAMGSACARAIAESTDVLMLTDRRQAELDTVVSSVRETSDIHVDSIVADLADETFSATLSERVRSLGELQAFVHTAGISPTGSDWRQVFDVDLTAVGRLLDALGAIAVPGSAGVCVASIAGHMGRFDPTIEAALDNCLAPDFEEQILAALGQEPDSGDAYRLAKRGVIRLCERESVRWGARGGRVVTISPGLMDTEMGRIELREQPAKPQLVALTPIHSPRVGDDFVLPGHLEDIADAAAFLCSPAASFITGCDLRVDGGLVAALNHPKA